jgi:hypothetical protein
MAKRDAGHGSDVRVGIAPKQIDCVIEVVPKDLVEIIFQKRGHHDQMDRVVVCEN